MIWRLHPFCIVRLMCVSAALMALPRSGLAADVLNSDRREEMLQAKAELRQKLSPNKALTGQTPTAAYGSHRIEPPLIGADELRGSDLHERAVEIPRADLASLHGSGLADATSTQSIAGRGSRFSRGVVLAKFKDRPHVAVLRVTAGSEFAALQTLSARSDVEFAGLDVLQERQHLPDDPQFAKQWHHAVIGSSHAWEFTLGSAAVRIAIVDTPFQMDHPDLSPNVDAGWDVIERQPVTSHAGIHHSTMAAGLAAGVLGNGAGIAGVANCRILPINIVGFTSEMYDAVVWAADNGVRVVNISFSGAEDPSLNAAGSYLKNKTGGMLVMAGINAVGQLEYPNHPHVCAVSMTDEADNARSANGPHIDFAAPGWQIFSTTTGASYGTDSGTSFAAPLFSGIVAALMSINPELTPDNLESILKASVVDRGQPGWDPFFGWGRIDFARAATLAGATLPPFFTTRYGWNDRGFFAAATADPRKELRLWRAPSLNGPWALVPGVEQSIDGDEVLLLDPVPFPGEAFYRASTRSK